MVRPLRRTFDIHAMALMLLAGFSWSVAAADLVIGVAGPMSGPLSNAGKQFLAAATLAAADINLAGGLNGDKIVIVAADDEATPAGAKKAAQTLIGKNVRAVIGHYNSAAAITASDIYLKHGVTLIAPTAIIEKFTDRDLWNVIRLAPRHDAQAIAAARYLQDKCAIGKIALAHDGAAFSKFLQQSAERALSAAGMKNMLKVEVPQHRKNAPAALSGIASDLVSADTSCLYWSGSSREGASLLLALRKKKSMTLFLGGENFAARDVPALLPANLLNGVRMTVPQDMAATPQASDIARRLASKLPGAEPQDTAPAIAAYAAMELLAAAARVSKSNDPRAMTGVLRSGKTFSTVAGPASFDVHGDRLEQLYAIYRWAIADDNKPVFVAD